MTEAPDTRATWTWRPTMTDRLRSRVRLTALAVGALTVGFVAAAALSPARFTIVVAFMIASIGVFWWLDHRRFRSTVVEVGADGILRIADGRQSGSIDLATVDSIEVRLRTETGQSIVFTSPRWTIEIAGPHGTLSHGIAHAAGLFNPEEDDLRALESGLRAQAERLGARLGDAAGGGRQPRSSERAPAASPPPPAVGPLDGAVDAPTPSLAGPLDVRFEWRPPVSPTADRRRRWYRIAYVGAALLVAVLGITSAWGDWVGVVLSALTVPGLILAFCGGIDWVIGRARRFRIVVDDGVLTVEPSRNDHRIALAGATVRVDKASNLTTTANSQVRTVQWYLDVQGADGSKLHRVFPGIGTVTSHDDYVALERELRRRT